jgi:hypothetical protein
METVGWTGVGLGAAALLLFVPSVREQIFAWGKGLGRTAREIFDEAKENAGVIGGAAALATAGATLAAGATAVAAPEAAAPAAGAAAAGGAGVAVVPALLQGLDKATQIEELWDHVTGKDKEKSGDHGNHVH